MLLRIGNQSRLPYNFRAAFLGKPIRNEDAAHCKLFAEFLTAMFQKIEFLGFPRWDSGSVNYGASNAETLFLYNGRDEIREMYNMCEMYKIYM